MKIFKYSFFTILIASTLFIDAKRVEFIENPHEIQAPQEVLDIVEEAINKYGFTKDYEVSMAKKLGFEQVPWYHFGFISTNQFTKNTLIGINPSWFLSLPKEQQTHFIFVNLIKSEQPMIPWIYYIVGILYFMLSIVCISLLTYALGIYLPTYSRLYRIIIAYICVSTLNWLLISPLVLKLEKNIILQHRINQHTLAVQKTGNTAAAIAYLADISKLIEERANKGEDFFVKIVPELHTAEIVSQLKDLNK